MNKPDTIDIVEAWFKDKFPHFSSEVSTGSCQDNKIIAFYRNDPKQVRNHYDDPWHKRNYIFTLSIKGRCWRSTIENSGGKDFSSKLNIEDPKFFEILEWRIKRTTYENR